MEPAKTWNPPAVHPADADVMPPNNRDAERSLLGCMIRDNSIIPEVLNLVGPDHFYGEAHGEIFRSISELRIAGNAADIVTLAEELRRTNKMDKIGGDSYLVELFDAAPCAANYKDYARIILMKAERRRLIEDGRERCYGPSMKETIWPI